MATIRCAIYTRKSTEEGLEQDFNTLDAQREACSAYITSQRGEGWREIPGRYDDGGYSGGNMERPGLVRLLGDIDAGRIDVVVVYKVDRLTRSLADFARIVERFDGCGASFVSVTQAFNTTTSMGRLTLNVLLSFAQFEREVTGERIRDKIAASKKKGMWMGGAPPYGYLPDGRTLKIADDEAVTVRWMFARYLELGSVHTLEQEMRAAGIVSRVRVTRSGKTTGGGPFHRGALFHLLRNRTYIGEIPHKDVYWPGLHPPIVDREVFDQAQALLDQHTPVRQNRKHPKSAAALTGLLKAANGSPMSPTSVRKGDELYRYYVCSKLQRGQKVSADGPVLRRVSAPMVEQAVATALRDITADPLAAWEDLRELLAKVTIHPDRIVLHLNSEIRPRAVISLPPVEKDGIRWEIPARFQTRGGRTWLENTTTSSRRRPDKALVLGLRRGHQILANAGVHPSGQTPSWRDAKALPDPYQRSLATLAFLAPDIQEAILDGRQPMELTFKELRERNLPLLWADQRVDLGLPRNRIWKAAVTGLIDSEAGPDIRHNRACSEPVTIVCTAGYNPKIILIS